MAYHILTTNLALLQLLADTIDAGEGYPLPGGYTLHHAIPEERHDGAEYALLADDVAAKYLAALVAAVVADGNAAQVAADWQALQAGEIDQMAYNIESGPFAGVDVRVGGKWPELDATTTAEGLARINEVLTANEAPTLPAGITVRQALAAIAPGVDFDDFDLG